MKRLLYIIITPLRRLYWFIIRPETKGVKVIIEHNQEVLMIKNTYGKDIWTFPGGAIEKNESAEQAAKREIQEETGIEIFDIRDLGEITSTREYKRDTIYCFLALVRDKTVRIDTNEIKEFSWFKKNELPREVSSIAKELLSLEKV